MSGKLRYRRQSGLESNRVIDNSYMNVITKNEAVRYNDSPTPRQKKYYSFLAIKCKENGLSQTGVRGGTRKEYTNAIKTMQIALKEIGIDVNVDKKPLYKFDRKTGNVIDARTGKVIRDGK